MYPPADFIPMTVTMKEKGALLDLYQTFFVDLCSLTVDN